MADGQATPKPGERLWWIVLGLSAALVVVAGPMVVVAGVRWYSLMLLVLNVFNLA
jgi:hypothetical protein